jgi:hypothetical protein
MCICSHSFYALFLGLNEKPFLLRVISLGSSKHTGGENKLAKKGSKFKCEECGTIVVVDTPCACAPCDLICCGEPMKEVKEKAKK